MQFNKPPEWGARFQFPENSKVSVDCLKLRVTEKMACEFAEEYDNFIADEIAVVARAAGVSDLTVLNKPAIIIALTKATPQQVIIKENEVLCPTCRYDMMGLWDFPDVQDPNYCPLCGQKLKWRAEDGK